MAKRRKLSVGQFTGQLFVALSQIQNGHREGFPALEALEDEAHNAFLELVTEMLASYDGWTIHRDHFIKKTLRLYDDKGNQIPGEHPLGAMDLDE